ncbi:MAG: FkbM family methyltransferase [Acidobacteria bacterium]|nr:FkbM family methyltransferase [Acidobacteriota bacterium]
MSPALKDGLKRVRASQPLNWAATTLLRACVGSNAEWAIKHLPRSGTVTSPLPNGRALRLRSRGDDWVSNQVFWRGWAGYEPEITPLFFRLATRARATLDVGAHVGFYSLLAAHANPRGRVYAFEPMPVTYSRLVQNVALNGLENVNALQAAVGAEAGSAKFYHGSTEIPCSCGLEPGIFDAGSEVSSFEVEVLALDDVAEKEGLSVDLVKIDTETTEMDVLRGLSRTLRRDRPDVFCEVWAGPGPEMSEFLAAHGYRCYALHPSGPVPYDGTNPVSNYLFTTKGADEIAAAS